jgi:uracil-DNA glycosylase family 4
VERTLEIVKEEALVCTKCRLAGGRTQVVFGVGNPDADLMFVGEAPGFHEDKQGEPFVGAAGQLLTKLLGDIGLQRADVRITNVLLCRPPGNRDPMPDEIESCKPWLKEQIELVDPRIICTLGNFATQLLLGKKTGITKVRGQRFDWRGRVLVPTFHPAAILRSGSAGLAMQQIEQDFLLIRKTLDEAPAVTAEDDSEQLGLF